MRIRQHSSIRLIYLGLVIVAGLSPPWAAAELTAADSSHVFRSDRHELEQFNGFTIDTIIIDNREIYDTDEEKYDKFLYKIINGLHFKTRAWIIGQEVLFDIGDEFSANHAEETARNLRNRLALYDAWVELIPDADSSAALKVVTVDQWSLEATFEFSRDGNDEEYTFGINEENVLGFNKFVEFEYEVQSDDDNIAQFRYVDPRFLRQPVRTEFSIIDGPQEKGTEYVLSRPFYSRDQRVAWFGSISNLSGRRDIYEDSIRVAQSRFDGDELWLSGDYRFGSYHQKWRFAGEYRYRYETTTNRQILATPDEPVEFANDSALHFLGGLAGWSNVEFVTLSKIDGFGQTEDFTVGFGGLASFGRAFTPSFEGHLYNYAQVALVHGWTWQHNLLQSIYQQEFWWRSGNTLRHTSTFVSQFYSRAASYLTIVTRLRLISDWRHDGFSPLILGGESGVRGLDTRTQTGDRLANVNFETRWIPGIEVLSVAIGGVVFADIGRAWKARDPVTTGDLIVSTGLGFRFDAFRSSRTRLFRVDFAYSNEKGWQLSIGTGQYFGARNLRFP